VVYVVDHAGRATSLRAYWEAGGTMATFTPAA
jgi:hypothetical protein